MCNIIMNVQKREENENNKRNKVNAVEHFYVGVVSQL